MMAKQVSKFLFICAMLLLASRFLYPKTTVFVSDEANFQLTLQGFMDEGKIPLTYCRGSSLNFPYGAGALKFYRPIHMLSNQAVIFSIYNTFFVTLGVLFFYLGLRNLVAANIANLALLSIASSPILFFLSRHLWENVLVQPIGAILFYLFTLLPKHFEWGKKTLLVIFLLGLITGYGFTIHLMFGAAAVASAITIFIYSIQAKIPTKQKIALLMIYAIGCSVFALPYLYEAIQIILIEKPMETTKYQDRWGNGRNIWWLLQRTVIFYSTWGARMYLKSVEATYFSSIGPLFTKMIKVDIWGWWGKLAAITLPFSYFFLWWKNKLRWPKDHSIAYLYASLLFFLIILVYNYLNIPTDPHYFNSLWWFVFLGIAWFLSNARKKVQTFLQITIAFTVCINIFFTYSSFAFFHKNHGAKNMEFGTALGEQEQVMRELCGWMDAHQVQNIQLSIKDVFVHPYPIQFHFRFLPECQGKSVTTTEANPQCKLHYSSDPTLNTDASMLLECNEDQQK